MHLKHPTQSAATSLSRCSKLGFAPSNAAFAASALLIAVSPTAWSWFTRPIAFDCFDHVAAAPRLSNVKNGS